jgi:ribosomal protein S10
MMKTPKATGPRPLPTAIVAITVFAAVAITYTVLEPSFAT